MKKISWIPKYDDIKKYASSRIRVHYPHTTLNKNFSGEYESVIGFDPTADVLIVQKRYDAATLNALRSFKGLKIFDFDDPIPMGEAQRIADIITTDTQGRKEDFDRLNIGKTAIVLEDCLDYGVMDIMETPDVSNRLVWFGNYPMVSSIKWMLPTILNSNFKMSAISDSHNLHVPAGINKIQWDVNNFISDLRSSNICILSHKDWDKNKSNNKMIIAIACGVPCIVNGSISYSELANKFSLGYSIVNTPKELQDTMEFLNVKENRENYLKEIQPYIINKLSSNNITKKLINIIENA